MAILFVVGLFCFLAFIIYAVWRTECYDESESFLYNIGATALGFMILIAISSAFAFIIKLFD